MAGTPDRRSDYQQVDDLITDALVELLTTMSLDKVKVKDIAAKAGVSRAAFYLHFEDKYAVVEKLERRLIGELVEVTWLLPRLNLRELDEDGPFTPFKETYAWAARNRRHLAALHGPSGDLSLADRIKREVKPYFMEFVRANGVQGANVEPVYQAVAAIEEYRMLMYVSDAAPMAPGEMGRLSCLMIKGLIEQFSWQAKR